jgi:nitrate/nitrite-specific signal transduction histidine kinase
MIAGCLESVLLELAENIEYTFGIACSFECDARVLINDNVLTTHLFYIAQEAVHNALKHGKADLINIDLLSSSGKITLRITDNRSGISDTGLSKVMGLRIMSYHDNMIHVEMNIESVANGGTVVSCLLRNPEERTENRCK